MKITEGKKKFFKEIKAHKLVYLFLAIILVAAFTIRVWRIDQVLGFYFDQGRDALTVERILNGDIVLIGPTTGIAGIFRGPFYYYFLVPGYFIGQGDPSVASVYQTIFIIIGYGILFYLLKTYFSFRVALIAVFFLAFSFYKILDDRWLSNPTPATLFSPLAILFFCLSLKRPLSFLPLFTFCLGLLLQLETASSFFLTFLSIVMIALYRQRYSLKTYFLSLITFVITLVPQIVFEFKNNFLQSRNFLGFLTGNTYGDTSATFQIPTVDVLTERLNLFSDFFLNRVIINFPANLYWMFLVFLLFSLFLTIKYWSKPFIRIAGIWFLGALILLTFYQGNYGLIYGYYLTSLVPIFFAFLALIINYLLEKIESIGKSKYYRYTTLLLLMIALGLFLLSQQELTMAYVSDGLDGETTISLGNQKQAVEYVLKDSNGESFNVDVYVPPVIPYAYDYLFSYIGNRENVHQNKEMVLNLYTIHEVDLEKPKREEDWLKRQAGIGKIEKQVKFGGIKVEKRHRMKYE